jgi:hypothetical protein
LLFKRTRERMYFLIFPLLYYIAIVGFGRMRWGRWLIPSLPFEAMFFGVGFYALYEYFKQRKFFFPNAAWLMTIILALISAPVVAQDIKSGIKFNRPNSRIITKDWVEKNIPKGSKIAYEYSGPTLQVNAKNNFLLINMGGKKIVSQPLSYYQDRAVDYMIITRSFKESFYFEPNKYGIEISRYEELRKKARLMEVFNDNKRNPGPAFEIYKLK